MLVTLTVGRNDAGQRADRYVRRSFPRMGLDRINSLFRRKEIKVARKPIPRGHVLEEGDELQVYGLKPEEADRNAPAPGAEAAEARPSVFDIPVLHEDEDILVLDKPAGLAVHPGTGIRPGDSVIEKVRDRDSGRRRAGEIFQPSLVHRLDKDTSGVLVVALSGPALRGLTGSLREGGFEKRYLALVEGVIDPPEGSIEGNLLRVDSRAGGAKAAVVEDDGKTAITHYRTAKVVGNFSLLRVIIETGRMHQIRAHLAHLGHPLAGDDRYGSHERNRAYRKGLGLKRIFLHAADLEVELPGRGRRAFHSPLPADLASVLERISSSGGPAA
jgi:23S rRNA pseudouridine955/2504/2580 synthase